MKTKLKRMFTPANGWIAAILFIAGSAYGAKSTTALIPDPDAVPLTDAFNPAAAKQLLSQGIREVVFIKRHTFDSNHYYTEYLNSKWKPGGNLCVLNLETGNVREVVPELSGGVFNRFDVSFDAKKIVFDYKKSKEAGYRIYEVNVDGTGLRQITFPAVEEAGYAEKYNGVTSHLTTDDLHPCYLPDGGFAFVSTRIKSGVLCDQPDRFTTKVLYRMNADGSGIRPLSNSVVSEACPTLMPDGRILYHRWEYNDKSQVKAKCLWAVRPDGTGSVEIYGNTLTVPNTLIYGRTIPGAPHKMVALACTHCCPNNALGSIVVIDSSKDIRSLEPLTYITKDIGARTHNGFDFLVDGEWMISERTGRPGRLFKDPYPISEELFIVSHKPKGYEWSHPNAFDLVLLNEKGEGTPLYQTKDISCWHPYPLIPREKPPVLSSSLNSQLAKENKAVCIVTDVYVGLEGVARGTVKHLRILEQVPRPWAAHTLWHGDAGNGSNTIIGHGRLGVKVQYGVVPVEEDGSACFEVPAGRNIHFQALDENYMMVQTERTYVNYMPGETRSCLGCHETQNTVPQAGSGFTSPLALRRAPSKPQAQPGDASAQKVIDYMTQIQPILDQHCVSCHGADSPKNGMSLTAEPTPLYTVSYESLMGGPMDEENARAGERLSVSEVYKTYGVEYRGSYYSGSHTSVLVPILSGGKIMPLNTAEDAARIKKLADVHKGVALSQGEFVTFVNWLDTFGQFYPSYWGLKNADFKGLFGYRPEISFEEAIGLEIPEKLVELYQNPPPSEHLNPKNKSKKSTGSSDGDAPKSKKKNRKKKS
ncbi:HzsA-related protein [Pontiella sulfatireligans]|uniref:Hydrazine synthase alpha subunit middle domain-containing protein n=1 Tax=Pontiella sulfatireligans TaxID=2750658 RepID=A0A6C2UGB2_9BACT|nr:hypothetical protein [Pontiella sulfatireligans]VGO18557.1 hypothetical protein SCARR_00610 [Pontiella sulfatireligans]